MNVWFFIQTYCDEYFFLRIWKWVVNITCYWTTQSTCSMNWMKKRAPLVWFAMSGFDIYCTARWSHICNSISSWMKMSLNESLYIVRWLVILLNLFISFIHAVELLTLHHHRPMVFSMASFEVCRFSTVAKWASVKVLFVKYRHPHQSYCFQWNS